MNQSDISSRIRKILSLAEFAEDSLSMDGENFDELDKIQEECKKLLRELDGTYVK